MKAKRKILEKSIKHPSTYLSLCPISVHHGSECVFGHCVMTVTKI